MNGKRSKQKRRFIAILLSVMIVAVSAANFSWLKDHTPSLSVLGISNTPATSSPNSSTKLAEGTGCQKESTLPPRIDPSPAEAEAFMQSIAPGAIASMKETRVPASVTIAQAAHASDFGRSELAQKANNFFGMKGEGMAGSYTKSTTEYIKGCWVKVLAKFRKYHRPAESITGHGKRLATSPHYKKAMELTSDPDAFAKALTGVYATDPLYDQRIIALMEKYDLYRFDKA